MVLEEQTPLLYLNLLNRIVFFLVCIFFILSSYIVLFLNYKKIFENENTIIIPKDDYNILPLLYISDTLVSEASGAITEFLGTGKTGVIYNLDQDSLKHSDGEALLGFDNREYLKDSFVHINTPDELQTGIELALKPTVEMKKAQKTERDKIFFKLDGYASKRVKQKVEELISERLKV